MALVNFDTTNKGKRVELVYTNDPYTRLRPGAKGTYEGCLRQPDGKHQHCIKWDDGSLLMMIEGIDRFKFIEYHPRFSNTESTVSNRKYGR